MGHASALQRVQKLLATEGIGSRRDIEELVRRGAVRINGAVARLGDCACAGDDIYIGERRIVIRGAVSPRVIAYHKPCGEVVSRSDRFHKTVFPHFPPLRHGRWVAVGRLDIDTSGVLLACTDGELAHRLMHPSYRMPRTTACASGEKSATPCCDACWKGSGSAGAPRGSR